MPELERPGDVLIHWERRGNGPLVAIAGMFNSPPSVLGGLVGDLATDHTVATYDLRGNGRSTQAGPYEVATDAGDLGAVIEAASAPAAVVAIGYGAHCAIRLAAARDDLVTAVVVSGTLPVRGGSRQSGGGLAGSGSVLQAFTTMYEVDHRAAMRTTVAAGNPNLSEDQVRDRVEEMVAYSAAESGAARVRSWIGDDISQDGAALGDRLWVLYYEGNPWFPATFADGMREVFPQAHFEAVEDGAVSRPDLTAAVVRQITRPAQAGD
jgi:pimeloyl-ACP methyl ester carboxylesterase